MATRKKLKKSEKKNKKKIKKIKKIAVKQNCLPCSFYPFKVAFLKFVSEFNLLSLLLSVCVFLMLNNI